MKPGRKPKPGSRYPCGKRTISQRQEDIISVAIEGRMRTMGISRELAKDPNMGSPLGRLLHWKYITAAQADAGYSFAQVMREYISSAKLQRGSPAKANFVPGQPDNGEGPSIRGEGTAKRYTEALAEIDRSDPFSAPTVTSIVWRVCYEEKDCHDEKERGALRVGLNAIHRILYGRKAA